MHKIVAECEVLVSEFIRHHLVSVGAACLTGFLTPLADFRIYDRAIIKTSNSRHSNKGRLIINDVQRSVRRGFDFLEKKDQRVLGSHLKVS